MTAHEHMQIEFSLQVSANLLRNIPRLENVADAVALSRRGYDGTGVPTTGPRGADLPAVSRLLRILVDIVDISTTEKISEAEAVTLLRLKPTPYDPHMLRLIGSAIEGNDASAKFAKFEEDVPVFLLRSGDQILRDVMTSDNQLLLSARSILSDIIIQRLIQYSRARQCKDRLLVVRTQNENYAPPNRG